MRDRRNYDEDGNSARSFPSPRADGAWTQRVISRVYRAFIPTHESRRGGRGAAWNPGADKGSESPPKFRRGRNSFRRKIAFEFSSRVPGHFIPVVVVVISGGASPPESSPERIRASVARIDSLICESHLASLAADLSFCLPLTVDRNGKLAGAMPSIANPKIVSVHARCSWRGSKIPELIREGHSRDLSASDVVFRNAA
jgi:hypothetical protein